MKRNKTDFFSELYSFLKDNPISLKELFENRANELGLSSRQLESGLNIERKSLIAILEQEGQRIDIVNLLKIGSFLNQNFEETIKILIANLPIESIKEIERARKFNFIINNFDIRALKSAKFFDSISDFDDIEQRLLNFFGLRSIYDYEKQICAAFSKSKRNSNNKMLDFWVKATYAYFEKVNNQNEFDRASLIDLIPKIKPYTRNISMGLSIVVKALYSVGVTVVYQSYFPNTQVRGATYVINNKPCIVLTNYNKNYATLWFALLHELYHVLYDFEDIQNNTFHLTGENDLLLLSEEKADKFARQYLLADEKAQYIYPFIHEKLVVDRYAERIQIHPSIIYNFYCFDKDKEGKNYYGIFQKLMPDISETATSLNTSIWQQDTIEKSVLEFNDLITTINNYK